MKTLQWCVFVMNTLQWCVIVMNALQWCVIVMKHPAMICLFIVVCHIPYKYYTACTQVCHCWLLFLSLLCIIIILHVHVSISGVFLLTAANWNMLHLLHSYANKYVGISWTMNYPITYILWELFTKYIAWFFYPLPPVAHWVYTI